MPEMSLSEWFKSGGHLPPEKSSPIPDAPSFGMRDIFAMSGMPKDKADALANQYKPAVKMKDGGSASLKDSGSQVDLAPYGLRHSGQKAKGSGYFGPMRGREGVVTELSSEDDIGEYPLIVPTLTRQELDHLLSGGEPTEIIHQKAKSYAEMRRAADKDTFADPSELRYPMPEDNYAAGGLASGGKTRAGTKAEPFPWEEAAKEQYQRTKARLKGLATDPDQELRNISRQYFYDPTLSREENELKLEELAMGFAGSTKVGDLARKSAMAGEELARLRPQELADVTSKTTRPVPPPLPRAKPKTKEEISAIAERIAPQMTGEFVRKAGKTENVAGKSRKQFDIEKDLEHEITRSRDVPEAQTISLEPHKGSVMLSLPGDTSISDFDIHKIGGTQLREPSRQYGGPRYGLGHPEEAGWASGIEPAKGFQRRVTEASKQYGDAPVIANYMAMGPEGMNYALHFSDALLKSIDPTKMTPRNIEHTNRIIRAGNPKSGLLPDPDFPGIEHPEASYLHLAENPATRKHFNSVMQLTNTAEALGLPSGLNVRHAITEPELRDLERGMTGFSLMQMQPEVSSLKASKHPTYSHDIPGKFLGRTEVQAPYELVMPDTVAQIRGNPRQAGSEFGTLQMGGGRQIIDQQLLDEIAQYRERIKQLTGKKKGGSVSTNEEKSDKPTQTLSEWYLSGGHLPR